MTSPTVSVIVPVFNGEGFIDAALTSLRREGDVEAEFVVVDDGSTDGSMAIVKAHAGQDPRFRCIMGEHRGVSAARNIGVRAATGPYVTFLDCDDICPQGRIVRQFQKLVSHPEAEIVLGETLWFESLTPDHTPAPGTRSRRGLCVTLHSALFRRSVFDDHGLFDERLASCEDFDFFLRLLEGDVKILIETEIASLYRRHPNNMTRDVERLKKEMLAALHRSISRRRAAGRNEPLDFFFARQFEIETMFASAGPKPASVDGPALEPASNDIV